MAGGMLPLGERSHEELLRMRAAPGADQGMLAPPEHRAFAREWMAESPVLAGLSLPFAIPAYSAAKALGLHPSRSPASMDELFAGYHGWAEGLLNQLVPSAQATPPVPLVGRGMLDGSFPPPQAPRPMRTRSSEGGVRG